MKSAVIVWALCVVIAFLWLRKLALRDFGIVTVAGVIGLVLISLMGPFAFVTAFFVSTAGGDTNNGVLSKTVWRRDQ